MQMCRGLTGLNIVGADLVELSPGFDATGNTAWLAASVLFEILCSMVPGVATRKSNPVPAIGDPVAYLGDMVKSG